MTVLDLMTRLAGRAKRPEAAAALARAIGAESVLLFVRDPALGALIPAPGLPQTVRGGATWRDFLATCGSGTRCTGEVEQPPGTFRSATALTYDGAAFVALGGMLDAGAIAEVERMLPLVAALLGAEQDTVLARAEAAAANEIASRAQTLATALEAARADAASLNAELREEHVRKDDFLAMLGHELRNPLSPLMTSVELLRRVRPGEAIPPRLLDIMARQIAHLTRLVDDLLDAARVSRGRIELKRELLLLHDVIHDAIDETQELIAQRGHELTVSGVEEALAVSGDRVRLMQVFANLLNNAARYTEAGGRISVSVAREGPNAIVRMADSGIGLAPEMLPRVFELFVQAPASYKHAQGGLGIGLTLVRMLVELHGGRVSVASEGVGRGSIFTVSLPLVPLPPSSGRSDPVVGRAAPVTARLRVMIVDDNRDAADSIALLLNGLGHETEVVYSAAHALQARSAAQADLILLDIGLPGMDGYELARRLRRWVKPTARLVALTGFGAADGARRSREAGFDQHLVKPVTADVLRQVLADASACARSEA